MFERIQRERKLREFAIFDLVFLLTNHSMKWIWVSQTLNKISPFPGLGKSSQILPKLVSGLVGNVERSRKNLM